MAFTKKTFDLKKFAGAAHRVPCLSGETRDPDALTPGDINPCLLPVYTQILRENSFDIANLDFGAIGEGDIDELENVLTYSPANRLFEISEVFRSFVPSAAAARVFI